MKMSKSKIKQNKKIKSKTIKKVAKASKTFAKKVSKR